MARETPLPTRCGRKWSLRLRLLSIYALFCTILPGQPRVVTSVIPSLTYGAGCSSTLQIENLTARRVAVEVQGHRESGALVAVSGLSKSNFRLNAHETGSYQLKIAEQTSGAWARVRETIPSPELNPALAISASTECRTGDELHNFAQSVVFPSRNPWFSGDVSEIPGDLISMINTSEAPARATACYSSGSLYSVGGGALQHICNSTVDVQIAPFSSRRFAVVHDGSTHFSFKTVGEAIVLEMLRPADETRRTFTVETSITFGSESEAKP